MSFPPASLCHFLILGHSAGVIGLQTSISLLEAGYRVLLIGQYFPGDESIEYTSPWYVAIASLIYSLFFFRAAAVRTHTTA
jgi:glycine/D-amino acid oxidase-like deaminating enzyme